MTAIRDALMAAALLLAPVLHAQQVFPPLEGETVEGTVVSLPIRDGKSYTVVALAYGKKAEPLLEKWYAPAYARFVDKHGLFAGTYDVELFLAPLFVGMNKPAYGSTMNKLRKEVDPDVARRVLFVREDPRGLIEKLGMTNKDVPYFFVLDPGGRILKKVSGPFSVDRLDELEAPMLQ
ncbi:MAG TPA: hypothetical protein PKD45_14665 [Flavobacteriales bacterium]|nr:hypothetical protein [Flavobacteriales bacterium]